MKKAICSICGREYETAATNSRYCSLACKEKGRKERRAAWEAAHPAYNREYMKAYRKKRAQEAPQSNENGQRV